jgi:hypothetical protein
MGCIEEMIAIEGGLNAINSANHLNKFITRESGRGHLLDISRISQRIRETNQRC